MPGEERDALGRTIAIANGKGGVLKTSTATNVGGTLAASGLKVLLVDLDPQGNIADDLGYSDNTEIDDDGTGLATALMFPSPVRVAHGVRENLDVIVGGSQLNNAAAALAANQMRDPSAAVSALRRVLAPIADQYDFIIIDCPPGEELLQTAALGAARHVIVPVKSDEASLRGVASVARRFDAVRHVNPDLALLGVAIVGVNPSAKSVEREVRADIEEMFPGLNVAFNTTIRHAEATARRARRDGRLISELETNAAEGPAWHAVRRGEADAALLFPRSISGVAGDYQGLTQEIVDRIITADEGVAA